MGKTLFCSNIKATRFF